VYAGDERLQGSPVTLHQPGIQVGGHDGFGLFLQGRGHVTEDGQLALDGAFVALARTAACVRLGVPSPEHVSEG
jgi:hypothetical protein